MSKRFIQKSDIPQSLWSVKHCVLTFPSKLIESWKVLLESNGLIQVAQDTNTKGPQGGKLEEETNLHLAHRYTSSCARVILSMLDPYDDVGDVADVYASVFSGGKVFMLDIPSGSGAACVSVLTILDELRSHSVLPRVPVDITILAGEISPTAHRYLLEQLERLASSLETQAIFIKFEVMSWDVKCKFSTANLIKRSTLLSHGMSSRILIMSNFSGFLTTSGNWKEAQQQFENIFLHSRERNSYALWIEPGTNAVKHLFTRLTDWFLKIFEERPSSALVYDISEERRTEAKYFHPLKQDFFPARLTVRRFDLPEDTKP